MAQPQRPLRGSRISTFYPVKSLPSLSSLDSAFQLQEYISLLIRLDVHDVDAIVSVPGRGKQKEKEKETEDEGKKAEVTVDEACWKYEQLRRLAQDLSHPLITMLQQVCTRTTCPEMKAGEWLYLCVAHGNDGAMEQCCAIDYILHTLDSATALLNSPRAFPSRLQIPPTSHRHFSSLARRLGRIFAHAYFHHREEFEQAEAESSLYARFLALTEKFDLVPADFLVIPSRAVGGGSTGTADRRASGVPLADVQPPTLLGAALHIDVPSAPPAASASASEDGGANGNRNGHGTNGDGTGVREKSASPEGRAPRYGRSRTDTMMLEGDKDRFPPSPASPSRAVEDGQLGLAAAVAEISPPTEQQQQQHPSVAESPISKVAAPPAAEAAAAPDVEPKQETEPEPEAPRLMTDAEQLAPRECEGGGGGLPVVSPSSSTAPQYETPLLIDVEQVSPTSADGAPPPPPLPRIEIEPATPPADADVRMGSLQEQDGDEENKDEDVAPPEGGNPEKVEDAAEAVPVPAPSAPEAESSTSAAEAKPEEPLGSIPATPAPAPGVDEGAEVSHSDAQKERAEVAPQEDAPAADAGTEEKPTQPQGDDISEAQP